MSTHINAKRGEIAEVVLMPGDPLRAKYIAETFLDDPVCYNQVRNALGFTGTYKGKRVSIQSTGMGIPSISIYANELINDFGAKVLIRVGSTGAMAPDLSVRDIVLVQGATTDSSIIQNTFGSGVYYAALPDYEVLSTSVNKAKELGIDVYVGNILSEDRFYNDEIDRQKLVDYEVVATEMESAGLFLLGAKYHVKTGGVLTVSNHLTTGEETTAAERERSFDDMIKIALETATSFV